MYYLSFMHLGMHRHIKFIHYAKQPDHTQMFSKHYRRPDSHFVGLIYKG